MFGWGRLLNQTGTLGHLKGQAGGGGVFLLIYIYVINGSVLFLPLAGELTTPHIVQQIQNARKKEKKKRKDIYFQGLVVYAD